ncbi:MAG: glycoside hydrolase family 9 protein [Thermoguttaceae bacterium]|jgi:endoglucanase
MRVSTLILGSLTIVLTLGAALLPARPLAAAESSGESIIPLDKPFTFAYLAWEKKVRIDNGAALLDAQGLTPKGGAGVVASLDLSGHADDCLALRVKVGPRNTMKTLRLLLGDAAEHSGTWHFPLPRPSDKAVLLIPADGAPLSHANDPGKGGAPALGKIVQWQLIGDWSGEGPVDLRVEAILAVKPNDEIRRARVELVKRDEAARVQAEKDRTAARDKYGKRTADSPRIEALYAAGPDVLALQIRQGKLTPCKLSEYKPLPGDEMNKDHHLIRKGQDLGMLVGPPGKESGLVAFEGFSGDPLLLAEADDAANFQISSSDDPAFARTVAPQRVMRKSKADDWQQFVQGGMVVVHRIYLKLPARLTPGKTYTVSLGNVNADKAEAAIRFDPAAVWSEVIHVNQIGFRPDDPLKQAFLSVWMGSGGGYDFPPRLAFHLVDAATGKSVYSGTVGEAWPAGKPEKMQNTRNFNGTSVSPIDFSEFKTPGRYRIMVEGVGCSYPFEIGPKAWQQAFWVQMKGFYNQRSGIELGPPYTDFIRPACWKPGVNDCMPITQSTYSVVDGNPNVQANLAAGDTGKPVPEAWGGYHDAGDWNPRRIDHMRTTTFWQLELLQLFPDYFGPLKLNIPDDAPGPDLLKECLFELDLFRRLQLPDGGCRYGIETNGDPGGGEVSWKQHMPGYVFAPDIYSSYIFAAVAARAAQVLAAYDEDLAKTYREAALQAMRWAEADRARRKAKGAWDKIPNHREEVYQNRNLAAVCLYALTQDRHWNEVFLEDTVLKTVDAPAFRGNQAGRDAAFTYARLPDGLGDPQVKNNARHAVIADANGALDYQRNNAFGIASDDFGKPQFIGFYSNPHGAVCLVRAHYLTRESKYLAGAVKACLFPAGANPNNLVYTSGVGTNYVKPMNMDAIATGQKPPIGLTPYGNIDLVQWHDTWITWPITWFTGKHCQPGVYDWPTAEAFFDVRFWISYCEFCTDQTMGPNAYVWGYLAARK